MTVYSARPIKSARDIHNRPYESCAKPIAFSGLRSILPCMKKEILNRLKRTALLSLIALFIGGGIGLFQIYSQKANVGETSSHKVAPMAGIQIGGPFTLRDHNGQTVTQESFAQNYKLIYFGFTYCPAICPTELQKVTRVMNALGETGKDIQPLFVSIDPERDTPAVMADYVSLFHPRLIGLTGSREQVDVMLKNYRVFAQKVEDPQNNDYTMDHSSYIYLMSPDDQLLAMYRIQDDAQYVTKDIKARLPR